MKYSIIYLMLLLYIPALAQVEESSGNESPAPEITFEQDTHDFEDITQGEKVEAVFKFKNSGKEPLVISNVLVTCGCTATQWPREPIEPGKNGELKVTFNSTGKMGKQNKIITVVSNAKQPHSRVKILANVLPK